LFEIERSINGQTVEQRRAVRQRLSALLTDDRLFGKGVVRADGRKIHDAYLFEVKKPTESKYPGDF
jgi:branched-chain amino acid transport system substrate-binding protein